MSKLFVLGVHLIVQSTLLGGGLSWRKRTQSPSLETKGVQAEKLGEAWKPGLETTLETRRGLAQKLGKFWIGNWG